MSVFKIAKRKYLFDSAYSKKFIMFFPLCSENSNESNRIVSLLRHYLRCTMNISIFKNYIHLFLGRVQRARLQTSKTTILYSLLSIL